MTTENESGMSETKFIFPEDGPAAMLYAAIVSLIRERDEARASNEALMRERTKLIETKREQLARLTARAEAAEAEVASLKEALKPFADAAARYQAEWDEKTGGHPPEPDEDKVEYLGWLGDFFPLVTLGDFRRARRVLSKGVRE